MKATTPIVNNLKLHIRLTEEGIKNMKHSLLTIPHKSYNNFKIVRGTPHVYTVFDDNGFINITGVKGFEFLETVIPNFCTFFKLSAKEDILSEILTIDNISASGHFGHRVNLENLVKRINKNKKHNEEGDNGFFIKVRLNRNVFPGAVCKTRLGTISVFAAGKYVIVGTKCLDHLERVFQETTALIKTLSTVVKTNEFALTAV